MANKKFLEAVQLLSVGNSTGDILTLSGSNIVSRRTVGQILTDIGAASSSHNHTLDSLSNVTITSNSSGEILKWNGSAWINNTLTEAGIAAAGDTVNLTGNQTVSGTKTFSSTISGSISGNSGTATTLATARTISISGAVTGTATSFNGSANITIPITALDVGSATTGTLAVGRGGTGLSTLTAKKLLIGNGTSAILQNNNLSWDNSFESLSVGTQSALNGPKLYASNNADGTGYQAIGVYSEATVTSSSNSSMPANALQTRLALVPNSSASFSGAYSGISNNLVVLGSGTVGTLYGIRSDISINTSSLSSAYNVYLPSPVLSSGGTIGTAYAVYIEAVKQTGVTNNGYGIYQAGASDLNYFNGSVGVGISPSQKLHVSGNVRITGALYDSSNSAGTSGYVLTSTGTGTAWSAASGGGTWGSITGTLSDQTDLQGVLVNKANTNTSNDFLNAQYISIRDATNWSSGLIISKRGATGDDSAAVTNGSEVGYHTFSSWDGSAMGRNAYVIVRATQNQSTGNHGASYTIATTANGAADAANRLIVDSTGIESTGMVYAQGPMYTEGAINVSTGTASNPSYGFLGDEDTGLFRKTTNTLGVTVGGTEIASFSSSGLIVGGTYIRSATPASGDNTDLVNRAFVAANYSTTSHNHTLDSLSNVTITSNSNGEILRWSGSAWINNTLAEAGIAAASHAHSASDITSGTLVVARGGTGLATLTSGSFLVGNGTGNVTLRTASQVLSDIGAAASSHTHALGDLSNVTLSAPSSGQVLSYNGSIWVNSTPSGGDTSIPGQSGGSNGQVVRYSSASTWAAASNTDGVAALTGLLFKQGGNYYASGSLITGLSSLTSGSVYYLSTSGNITTTAPTPSSTVRLVVIGKAVSTTTLLFQPGTPITG